MRPRFADLLRRLEDPDIRQVDKAFDAILFDREQAVPDLVEAYCERDLPASVRYLVVQLLGFSGSEEAIPTVLSALDDASSTVRAEACRGLMDLRAREQLAVIRRRLEDVSPEVRRAALDTLSALEPQ